MLKLLFGKKSEDYTKYRWFFTSNDVLVIGGKNEEQNEEIMKNFLRKSYAVAHTSDPGSPFMIVQKENPDKKDIEEAAIFCACFSKKWKNIGSSKEKIPVDVFRGEQVFKSKIMKKGSFGIKGERETLKVNPELVVVFQRGKLRAVPKFKNKKKNGHEIIGEIKPGSMTKDEIVSKIFEKIKKKYQYPVTKEEIAAAIPSDKISFR